MCQCVKVLTTRIQSAITRKLIPSRFHISFEAIIQLVKIHNAGDYIITFTCSESLHVLFSPQNLYSPSTDRCWLGVQFVRNLKSSVRTAVTRLENNKINSHPQAMDAFQSNVFVKGMHRLRFINIHLSDFPRASTAKVKAVLFRRQ